MLLLPLFHFFTFFLVLVYFVSWAMFYKPRPLSFACFPLLSVLCCPLLSLHCFLWFAVFPLSSFSCCLVVAFFPLTLAFMPLLPFHCVLLFAVFSLSFLCISCLCCLSLVSFLCCLSFAFFSLLSCICFRFSVSTPLLSPSMYGTLWPQIYADLACWLTSCMFRPKCYYQTDGMDRGIDTRFSGDKLILLENRYKTHVRDGGSTFQIDA